MVHLWEILCTVLPSPLWFVESCHPRVLYRTVVSDSDGRKWKWSCGQQIAVASAPLRRPEVICSRWFQNEQVRRFLSEAEMPFAWPPYTLATGEPSSVTHARQSSLKIALYHFWWGSGPLWTTGLQNMYLRGCPGSFTTDRVFKNRRAKFATSICRGRTFDKIICEHTLLHVRGHFFGLKSNQSHEDPGIGLCYVYWNLWLANCLYFFGIWGIRSSNHMLVLGAKFCPLQQHPSVPRCNWHRKTFCSEQHQNPNRLCVSR